MQTMKSDLEALLRRRWVTPVIALQEANCFSLSQRCGEFRRAGLSVHSLWVDLPSGKKVKAYHIS